MESGQEKNASMSTLEYLRDAYFAASKDWEKVRLNGTTLERDQVRARLRSTITDYQCALATTEREKKPCTSSAEKRLNESTESQS